MHEIHNPIAQFTGNDELDLKLIQIEISSAYIDLLSMILGLTSAKEAIGLILQRAMQSQQNNPSQQQDSEQHPKQESNQTKQQQQQNTQHPTPSEIAAFSSCLSLYTTLIYTRVSIIRLNEIYNKIQAGTTNFSLTPNINITTGFIYSVIGSLLRTTGAIQRVDEEGKITIL
ncbi:MULTISPECIES: hypothetical protein [unclassified Clostridium]|uniref:hypothetical protein n=1 Tax=unclassified Clostridium TaxID=2614128 RepID=UPI0002977630|nr:MULTISPECIES: hypothetical protein [unclassified Clostridium]EKQ52856.1 MAG: hypothetical protein A370_04012 [Clostridium sp. Maddingley MBC34-26]